MRTRTMPAMRSHILQLLHHMTFLRFLEERWNLEADVERSSVLSTSSSIFSPRARTRSARGGGRGDKVERLCRRSLDSFVGAVKTASLAQFRRQHFC